jgi:hypothetical protein
MIHFALPFLQVAYFLLASEMMKRLASAHFSSESNKKYKRYFQPVCGKMNHYESIHTGTLVNEF